MRYPLRFSSGDDPLQVRIPASVPWLRGLLGAVLALALAAVSASAQAGTITGQVTAASSGAPMSAVQVYLAGTGTGTLTNSAGRYLLLNVPAGSYTIQVERIGYERATQEVTIAAGETVSRDFALGEEALGLDELVVTGTAGASRRREVGNSIGQLNTDNLTEPLANVTNLLQGRVSGVSVSSTSGSPGGGTAIRLRGNVSATMSNQPLIYVDGTRVVNQSFPKNYFPIGYAGSSDNSTYSPLNDINPEDIARIEIIKGPAATTLYGTEAAAGVIQIFTKRGTTGRARWTANISQTASQVRDFGPSQGFDGNPITIPGNEVDPYGTPGKMYLEPYLRTGLEQRYDLSVNGGTSDFTYFVSGGMVDQTGTLPNDELSQGSVRGNLSFTAMENLTLQWNSAYSRTRVRKTPVGGTAEGVTLNAFRRDRNYFNDNDPDVIGQVLDFDLRNYIDHLTTGLAATYSPTSAFSTRLGVGYDLADQETRAIEPFGFFYVPLGRMHDTRWQHRSLSMDYVASLSTNLRQDLTSSLSVGAQMFQEETNTTSAYSQDFPGPGEPTVSSGGSALGFESRQRVINAGFFIQDVIGLRDRYFLTLGARFDGNSAFGENLGLQMYPKVSASYVISDEPFWNDDLGSMKIRAAWGQAGRAPGAFDAVQTWDPNKLGNSVAFLPNNLGNPDLGPERTTEVEVGFDWAGLSDRLTVDATYYHQKTTDALFRVSQIPSEGGWGSQLANIGELENQGLEVTLNAQLVQKANWGWEAGLTISTNTSEVTDLGGASSFSVGNRGYIMEGQPAPVMRGQCVTNENEIDNPIVEPDCPYGPNQPTKTVVGSMAFRLPWAGMELSARGEYQGGHWAYSLMDGESITRGIRWPACFNSYPEIDAGNLSGVTARERAYCIPTFANRDFAIFPLDFFRMRDLTLSVPISTDFLGSSGGRIAISASNFYTWKKASYSLLDPETSGGFQTGQNVGGNEFTHSVGGSIPIPAAYTISLRINY
jgi:TonB-dependent SusC/RagA subfamily outer membrane receptor